MSYIERPTEISLSQIKDQIALLMYAYGKVNDNEEIVDIEIGELKGETVPLRLKLKKEVRVRKYNGT